jgi:hypothetical protein
MSRPLRSTDAFEVTCWNCRRPIEVACHLVKDGRGECPACRAELRLEWDGEYRVQEARAAQ